MRLIVGISGASGVIMGYHLLKLLRSVDQCETHLILTNTAKENFIYETTFTPDDVIALADYYHDSHNLGACISSGTFKTNGMIVAPCSMKTLAAIAAGYEEIYWSGLPMSA